MGLPRCLARILAPLEELPEPLRGAFLLDYAERMPEAEGAALVPVEECQTPFALEVRLDESGRVRLAFKVPDSAPTVRAFGGILAEGPGEAARAEQTEQYPGTEADPSSSGGPREGLGQNRQGLLAGHPPLLEQAVGPEEPVFVAGPVDPGLDRGDFPGHRPTAWPARRP